jgi:hypothetical protein
MKNFNFNLKSNNAFARVRRGFALLMTVIVMSTVLLITYALTNISLKELQLTASGRDSQLAFYAADTGMECALFWDTKNPNLNDPDDPFSKSAFAENASTINCGEVNISSDPASPSSGWSVPTVPPPNSRMIIGGSALPATSTFFFITDPDPNDPDNLDRPCAIVRVGKRKGIVAAGEDPLTTYTSIESRGYNTCNTSNGRRIERALKANY